MPRSNFAGQALRRGPGRRDRDRLAGRTRRPRLFVEPLADLHGMGWGELDVLDLNGLTRDVREGRLGRADVSWVTGGNQFHPAQSIAHADLHLLGEERIKLASPLFDWYVKPHLDSPSFRNRDEAWADRLAACVDVPLYLLDNDSAIRVRGDKVDVVSTGRWRLVGQ